MLQRLSIRGKILAVVAVPILVLLLAVGVVTLNATQSLNNARNVEQLLEVLGDARSFEADLQTERNLSVNYVDAVSVGANKRSDAEQATDAAVAALQAEVAENPTPEGEAALSQIDKAIGLTQPTVFLVDERSVDIVNNEIGEWPTFPSEEEVQETVDNYTAITTQIDLIGDATPASAGVKSPISSLSIAIGAESAATQTYLTEPAVLQELLIAAIPDTDASENAYDASTAQIDSRSENESVELTVADASEQLAQLPNVRTQVVNRSISVSVLNSYFGDTIQPVVKLSSDVSSVVSDRELAAQLRAYNAMDVLVERVRSEEVYTDHLLRAGEFLPGDSTFQRSLVSLSDIALDNAQATVDPIDSDMQVPPFGASADSSNGDTSSFESIRTNIASGLPASLITERGNDWPLQVSQELDVQEPIRDTLWEDAQANSADALQSTVLQTILTIVGAVLVVAATIFIALLIARRIIGPLRRLTTTATAVRQELPRMVERVALPGETVDVSEVQIPVESSDEIGRLAEAFNGVNAATLAIAGEQAALRGSISEMFVNVARRDQVLLNRQLSSIDEMERTEDDPDTLTRLFALDHLATRMRRNSESLLVLAGIDTGRRLRRPMPLADVIRTASSEIELYERVQLELDADPAMVGHSALTAAHLFAELLENATVFSDPGTPVVVRTFERDGNFMVEVQDSGIGMTVDELREANNRVASTAASEILGAQRLGLFVVGRIARRVGARVSIASKEGEGTVATVTMPPTLFDTRSQEPVAHVSTNAVDPAMNAPSALVGHNAADEVMDTTSEPDATKRPGAPAYQPATVATGASLVGRTDDAVAEEPAADQSSEPTVDDLIAADAAVAPEATAVDAAALAGGLTASGLPARRRRTSAGAEAASDEERAKIIGLPVRATPDQLSALDAEAPAGFTPSVSADEIAPQTAEERASMFRGFRSRKATEQEMPAAVDPEAESMGQAARRGAFTEPPVADAPEALEVPVEEAPVAPEVPVASAATSAEPESPAEPSWEIPQLEDEKPEADDRPTFAMPKFDSQHDAGSAFAAGAAGLGAAGIAGGSDTQNESSDAHDIARVPEEGDAPVAPQETPDEPQVWAIPQLEDDDHAVGDADFHAASRWGAPPAAAATQDEAPYADVTPVAEEPSEAAPVAEDVPEHESSPAFGEMPQRPVPSYGVEQVSLETGPTFSEPAPSAPAAAPPAPTGAPLSEGNDPAPYTPVPYAPVADAAPVETPQPAVPSHEMDPAALAALTATPSMDDLMHPGEDDDKPNFFSRLFGRGKKATDAPEPAPAPAVNRAPAAAPVFAPITPPSQPTPPAPAASPTTGFSPIETPEPAQGRQEEPAAEPVAQPDAQPAWGQFAPAVSLHDAPAKDESPWHTQSSPAPQQTAEPTPSSESAQPAEPAPPAPAPTVASFFSPRTEDAPQQTQFSPDELASPMGWEAAGASALQAAEPDVQTSYSPKVDLDSDHDGGSDLSSVFSEFSSLSAERPKVEKTRAGLQKRRSADAPPVQVTPIEEEVVVAPRERDADAVRSRFSSFYSGTERARSDAAEFERSQATSDVKE
ncbi:nitrate- and nitrite sensing domain-containing protein [Demequina oxidasica]|uniref:nitrate- and nitrite sensing domain-containing protein n=1 Tax=Demequina oxidasica TaxID=676199 RepID=UPI0007857B5B|nr:nitrate- and nitrite sensing domain-containing protein [Demequina oxidasica]